MTHIKCQIEKKWCLTPATQSILCLIFSMCIVTMHRLNYSGQESKQQFPVHESDIPVILKYNQGHQTLYARPQARL